MSTKRMKKSQKDLFISHSSKDEKLIDAFVELLSTGIGINPNNIFCTSSKGLGIGPGNNSSEEIERKLKEVKLLIAVISAEFILSEICHKELEAAQKMNKLYSFITSSVTHGQINSKFNNLQVAKISNKYDLSEMRDEIIKRFNVGNPVSTSGWESARDNFLKAVPVNAKYENEPVKSVADIQKVILERIQSAGFVDNIHANSIMILAAFDKANTAELKSIFSNTSTSIKYRLENPSAVSQNGWNLRTHKKSQIIEGQFIRVKNSSKILDLYRDGTFITVCLVDKSFLSHGSNGIDKSKNYLNPLAMAQWIYEFVHFYKEVIGDMQIEPKTLCFLHELRLTSGDKTVFLPPCAREAFAYEVESEGYPAPGVKTGNLEMPFSEIAESLPSNFDVGRISYDILKEIYVWFGHCVEDIPYTREENGIMKVDIKQIAK